MSVRSRRPVWSFLCAWIQQCSAPRNRVMAIVNAETKGGKEGEYAAIFLNSIFPDSSDSQFKDCPGQSKSLCKLFFRNFQTFLSQVNFNSKESTVTVSTQCVKKHPFLLALDPLPAFPSYALLVIFSLETQNNPSLLHLLCGPLRIQKDCVMDLEGLCHVSLKTCKLWLQYEYS